MNNNILSPFRGQPLGRTVRQVEDSMMDLLDEVHGVGMVIVQASDMRGGYVEPFEVLGCVDTYLVHIGIGGGSLLDSIASKSGQGFIWAIMCHELGHIIQWRQKRYNQPFINHLPTLRLAQELDAWKMAETKILPQLPEHMLQEVLKVWPEVKSWGLRSYAKKVKGCNWEMY